MKTENQPIEWDTGLGEIMLGRETPQGIVRMDGTRCTPPEGAVRPASPSRVEAFALTGKWIFPTQAQPLTVTPAFGEKLCHAGVSMCNVEIGHYE